MATSQDFDDLIVRIETATNTLETATNVVNSGTSDIQQAVADAEQAVIDASQHAADASTAADNSAFSAQASDEAYQDALALVQQLEAAVVLNEAPQDGQVYGRKDATWVLTSAGGSGTVTSVNNVEPDATGDVTLAPFNIGALPNTYTPAWLDITGRPNFVAVATSGAYSDLTGTPTIPTATSDLTNDSNYISEAPQDSEQYVRLNGAWSTLSVPSQAVAFPVDSNTIYANGSFVNEWVDENPHKTYSVDDIRYYSVGRLISGEEVFYGNATTDANTSLITPGKYHFTTSTFTQGPLQNKEGYIEVSDSETAEKYVTAFVNPQIGETEGEVYLYNNYDDEFIAVGASGDGGGGSVSQGFTFEETGFYIDGVQTNVWPHSNPNKGLDMSRCGAYVTGRWTEGIELFSNTAGIQQVPEGWYWTPAAWPADGSALAQLQLSIHVFTRRQRKQAIAYSANSLDTRVKVLMLQDGEGVDEWFEIANTSVAAAT